MSGIEDEWLEAVTPKVSAPYRMVTTGMMEHSHGVFWTADLYDSAGVKVGTVEQVGRGGPDEVRISPEYLPAWRAWLKDAYPGVDEFTAEEYASGWLMVQEEEARANAR